MSEKFSHPHNKETIEGMTLDPHLQHAADEYLQELRLVTGNNNIDYTFDNDEVITFRLPDVVKTTLHEDHEELLKKQLTIPDSENPDASIPLVIYASGDTITMIKHQSIDITV